MALDSIDKRRAIHTIYPVADGALNKLDRIQMMGLYRVNVQEIAITQHIYDLTLYAQNDLSLSLYGDDDIDLTLET